MMDEATVKNKILFEIDKQIDLLVKEIELLNYVNPINIESEKEKFFSSKYLTDPKFEYPKRDFDKFNLHKEFFKLSISKIEDETLRDFYEDIIYFYSGLIQCIETVGKGKKFYYNSLRSFGTPTENDVDNAKFILHFDSEDENSEFFKPKYSAKESAHFFREYSKKYDFTYQIKNSSAMGAIAMVSNSIQALVLNENHVFSDNEINVLTNHEIGVHMVTTMNGLLHPLKIFSHGFPNNEETQEGLAVFSEYMSGNLTVKRLKELAYRVLAVDSLAKGYSFSRTFRLLHNAYDLGREEAFHISVRAHRGGGFTKDYLYLSGLKKIYNYYKQGKDLSLLLTGKVSLEFVDDIKYMIDHKYAVNAKYITDSYAENNNCNKTVDFILENLK
ncbi:flavohemoglobin expression-modulating QEGLA motif protein [Polaribacter sp. MSW13]|uniref:Flavohemoglobin expression-modulating QEGLA motif protein n=2 Tax=Polaribacter marinus TaxID=2916838 RepID=A0A9X1VRE2_9FLAO|nr:tyrosine/phenylalanine carboxypeptidase domain-containing protein [Polaribacter marinus]MCI2228136.1 flavohemoglobin expression-modulating QEGLA motif protein [Polaribacter marinus]